MDPKVMPMIGELSSEEICSLLNLEPHATCGFVRISLVSRQSIAAGGLPAPFAAGRPLGSALYFMVTAGAPVRLFCIRNDQLYHYISVIRSKCFYCTWTVPPSGSSSDRVCSADGACSS
jgi:predicted cupin superfamily sugar epimerase